MSEDLKNQTTLFRFVSLRNPELTRRENQNKRFVFNSDIANGVFHSAVINRYENTTKWDTMVSAAESFNAFENERAIADLYPRHFELSDWIARNRSNINTRDLIRRLGIEELQSSDEVNLWDNLYYQVLIQKDFYVKEAVIQLLVLQNILKNKNVFFEEPCNEEVIKQLLSARVVLPNELFDELALMQYAKVEDKEKDDGIVSKELADARQIEEAKIATANITGILLELNEIEVNHREERDVQYNACLQQYQKKIEPEISRYQKEYNRQLREICTRYRGLPYDKTALCNQPDIEYPELPEFTFEYPQEPDMKTVSKQLSKGALSVLSNQIEKWDNISSVTKLKQVLAAKLQNEELQTVNKIKTSERIVVFGTTAIKADSFVSETELFKFQICSSNLVNDNVSMFMNIQLPSGFKVQKFVYTLKDGKRNGITDSYFNLSSHGNVVTISNMFNNTLPFSIGATNISGVITFTNGQKYEFTKDLDFKEAVNGTLKKIDNNNTNDSNTIFKPNTFGYRRLGIADYQQVVSRICRYEAGEVAHIENVMARELREKSTTRFNQRQVVETDSQEIEKEKITDTSTAERFEMQTEVSKILQQDKQFSVSAGMSAGFGPVSVHAEAGFAASVSKQESKRQAINKAKEVTQQASERIISRVKNERKVSTTEEFTENNTHTFDNREGSEHVSGVYRFINAVYKNQIYNYGKRLMYEFMIPQPAKLHRLGMAVSGGGGKELKEPKDPRETSITIPSNTIPAATVQNKYNLYTAHTPATLNQTINSMLTSDGKITDFTKINKDNYQYLAGIYNAKVNEYPREEIYVTKTVSNSQVDDNECFSGTVEISLHDGYITEKAFLKFFAKHDVNDNDQHAVGISFGNVNLYLGQRLKEGINGGDVTETDLKNNKSEGYNLPAYKENMSLSYAVENYHTFSIALSVRLKLDETKKAQWQKETFEAIIEGYNQQMTDYKNALAESLTSGVQILDSNPLFYRQIEQTVLRQNCISYLLPNSPVRRFGQKMYSGDELTNFKVKLDQTMDDYSSFIKFMEQAFEWDLMSYIFYPYYWANEKEWESLYKFDSDDATFRSFMQAGMARVVVTVRPGFERAVMHYMATGQIWNGGETPVIGDPLYLSIVDELKEQEYIVEGSWETMLPTNLIALQRSGVAIDASGLPVLDVNAIQGSNAKLGVGNEEEAGVPEPWVPAEFNNVTEPEFTGGNEEEPNEPESGDGDNEEETNEPE